MIKKVLIFVGIFALLVVIVDILIRPSMPEFVWEKAEEFMGNDKLMDSIGGKKEVIFYYDPNFETLDTFSYSIKIKGYEKELVYKSFHRRTKEKDWRQLKDTLTIH